MVAARGERLIVGIDDKSRTWPPHYTGSACCRTASGYDWLSATFPSLCGAAVAAWMDPARTAPRVPGQPILESTVLATRVQVLEQHAADHHAKAHAGEEGQAAGLPFTGAFQLGWRGRRGAVCVIHAVAPLKRPVGQHVRRAR